MKSLIIYYSQTGNTRQTARAIHRGLSRGSEHCDLKPVKEVKAEDLDGYDLVGLGTPVWSGGWPPNVRYFFESLPRQDGKHIFSFNTHGVMPELYFPAVVRKMKAKGFTVIGFKDWYGSVHFQVAPKPYFTDGHPDEIDLKEAEDFGAEMADRSQRLTAGETHLIPPVPKLELTTQLLVLLEFYQAGRNPHGRVTYDPGKCLYPKCRLCVDNCLMGYIDLDAAPRRFGSKGQGCDMWMGCTFCEMICPTGAISGDWPQAMQNIMGLDHVLGYNPLARAAEEAMASGRLRTLVSLEDMRPLFVANDKRPRFKIPKDE